MWLRLIGGIFLCVIGLKVLLTKFVERETLSRGKGFLGAYTSMFFLTLTYPMTILIFLGIFAGLGIGNARGNYPAIAALVFGVFIGSILWWAILSTFIGSLRHRLNTQSWQWVNKTSGTLIIGFGLAVLLSLIL
jgi:threonine/homoserine/homoserine lactone efflux protein